MIKLTSRIVLPCLLIGILINGLTGCRKSGQCEGLACKNGGYCSGDTCACPLGYSGDLCENFSVCDTIKCLNGGNCVNGSCLCANGYYGARCDSPMRDLYLGSYTGTLTISTSTTGIPTTAVVSADTSAMGITIAVSLFTMNAALSSGGNFTIPGQSGGLPIGSLSGSGSFTGNALNFTFAENVEITTINGSFTGMK